MILTTKTIGIGACAVIAAGIIILWPRDGGGDNTKPEPPPPKASLVAKRPAGHGDSRAADDYSFRTKHTNRPPVSSGSTNETEQLLVKIAELETEARSHGITDPVGFLAKVKKIPYPPYDLASASMKVKIVNICRNVGEVQSLSVHERMEYIFESLPMGVTPSVVDDMIRGLDAKGLDELNTWLTKVPKSPEKNEIYYVIGQRLKNLGLTPDEILTWAQKALNPEETLSILKAL